MNDLREDRYFSSIPFVSDDDFERKIFLQLYDQTERYPSTYKVINSLEKLNNRQINVTDVIDTLNESLSECDVIETYTSNVQVGRQTFYNYINQQLCLDHETTLRHLMPLIRRATFQINRNCPERNCYVYRGMRLNNKQRRYFRVGRIFRFPGFTSTSKSRKQAERFGDVLFEIYIYAGCLQVRDVSNISYFPYEQELIFSPYSLFKVDSIQNKMICLRALDNITKTEPTSFSIPPDSPEFNYEIESPKPYKKKFHDKPKSKPILPKEKQNFHGAAPPPPPPSQPSSIQSDLSDKKESTRNKPSSSICVIL